MKYIASTNFWTATLKDIQGFKKEKVMAHIPTDCRKPVSIAINQGGLAVVCDDGTVWMKAHAENEWRQKNSIPGSLDVKYEKPIDTD